MERKEEYYKRALEYVETHHSPSGTSDCQAAMNIAVVKAFMAGAKWADEHPHKPTREEILKELRAHAEYTERFYNLMAQIPPIEQLAVLQMEEGSKQTIEKACEWLEKNVWPMTGVDHFALSESFKKAMKE